MAIKINKYSVGGSVVTPRESRSLKNRRVLCYCQKLGFLFDPRKVQSTHGRVEAV